MKYFSIVIFTISLSTSLADSILPQYWPPDATLVKSLKLFSGKKVPVGEPFTLHRIEGKKALVTFGRDGTHWIELEETNITELSEEIKNGKRYKVMPNLIFRLYNKLFVQRKLGKYEHLDLRYFKDTQIILFFFAAGQDVEHSERIRSLSQQYRNWRETFSKFELIMIQEDTTVFKQLDERGRANIIWPFMSVTSSVAYSEYMYLEQSDSPSFVLAGGEGDIINRYSLEENTLEEIFTSVTDILKLSVEDPLK